MPSAYSVMFLPVEDPDVTGLSPLPTGHIIFTCFTVLDPKTAIFRILSFHGWGQFCLRCSVAVIGQIPLNHPV